MCVWFFVELYVCTCLFDVLHNSLFCHQVATNKQNSTLSHHNRISTNTKKQQNARLLSKLV